MTPQQIKSCSCYHREKVNQEATLLQKVCKINILVAILVAKIFK